MPFFHNFDLPFVERKLEKSYYPFAHKLRGDWPAAYSRKFFRCKRKVLARLNDTDLILATLRLDRNYIVASVLVETDVKFVDLNLTDSLHRCAKMVLQTICCQSQKRVYQAVVANDS